MINILNIVPVYKDFVWYIEGVVLILLIAGLLIIAMTKGKDSSDLIIVFIFMSLIIGFMLTFIIPHPIDHYEYECTINSNANLTEFTNKYEIISQRGEIYVVREK